MKTDRMLDRFALIFIFVVAATMVYFAWIVLHTGASWMHLYWIALAVWGFYVQWHVEKTLSGAREREFQDLVEDWVRRGSPDEPLDLRK
jgi:hypothetical protein